MGPTIIDGNRPGQEAYDTEIFGPVMAVLRYATVEEAVARANATPYGLAASVVGRDVARALAVAHRAVGRGPRQCEEMIHRHHAEDRRQQARAEFEPWLAERSKTAMEEPAQAALAFHFPLNEAARVFHGTSGGEPAQWTERTEPFEGMTGPAPIASGQAVSGRAPAIADRARRDRAARPATTTASTSVPGRRTLRAGRLPEGTI